MSKLRFFFLASTPSKLNQYGTALHVADCKEEQLRGRKGLPGDWVDRLQKRTRKILFGGGGVEGISGQLRGGMTGKGRQAYNQKWS